MDKVYVATFTFKYECRETLGVYESKKLAEEAIENYKENNPRYVGQDYEIWETEKF